MSIILRFFGFFAAALAGGCVVWIAGSYGKIRLPNAQSYLPMATLDITYSDFINVMLTCVTVVLAAVGIGVGVVAAYTIRNLRDDADRKVDVAVGQKMEVLEEVTNKKITQLGYLVGRKLDEDDNLDESMEDR